tara:strand:+ start:2335 stop:3801 length:1467 start_codon:yes stop_codon:yes gene_type:complete
MSTRYRGTSVEFGERLRDDIIKRNREVAKEQDDFAKKLAGAKFVVKGLSSFMQDRLDTFNNSMADEKAYLKATQENAQTFLNEHQNQVVDGKQSVYSYLDNLTRESWLKTAQDNIEGIMVEVPDKDGNIVRRQAYEVPFASLKNLKNFKIGKEEYATYEDLINERVDSYNKLLQQARDVPQSTEALEGYLDKYRDKQNIPTSVIGLVTKPVRRFLRGETRETLQAKINRTRNENLSDPIFRNFNEFGRELKAYNEVFPNATDDVIDKIKDLSKKKIIKDISNTFPENEITVLQGNEKVTKKQVRTRTTVEYVDNTTDVIESEPRVVGSKEEDLVKYTAEMRKALSSTLTPFGSKQWAEYQNNNEEKTNRDINGLYNSFLMDNRDELSKILKSDLEPSELAKSFVEDVVSKLNTNIITEGQWNTGTASLAAKKTLNPETGQEVVSYDEYLEVMKNKNKAQVDFVLGSFIEQLPNYVELYNKTFMEENED